jgi:hypothetical protein
VEFDILFGSGIDKFGCILDAAESMGVVERKGCAHTPSFLLSFFRSYLPTLPFEVLGTIAANCGRLQISKTM